MKAPLDGIGRGPRAVVVTLVIVFTAALHFGQPALAQDGTPPAGFNAAIDAALEAGERAGANAALSASIANDTARDDIVAQTRTRIQEAGVAEVVIRAIASHPESVSAIVTAAVAKAPAYREAIVYRASLAFPGFAAPIAKAAGTRLAPVPMPVDTGSLRAPIEPPETNPLLNFAVYKLPAANPLVLAAATADDIVVAQAAAPAAGAQQGDAMAQGGPFGLSELRLGVLAHDAGVFGRTEEDGIDVTLEARFQPFPGRLSEIVWSPRPHLGVNVNSESDTSSAYLGLTWEWNFWRSMFLSLDLGGAVHDGKLGTSDDGRKELGSRVLFREAIELGFVVHDHHALSIRLDHISNASLADNNEGLDTVGVVYGYRF
jgi:hypothetical protein